MANSQAMATSFKSDILQAFHNFGTTATRAGTGADTFKGALYLTTASLGAATASYSATGEASGANYTAGGAAFTNATPPTTSGTTAYWTPSASISWSNVTLATAFDTILMYNSTNSNKAVGVFTFGAQTVTAGTFTLTMPTNDSTNALVRIA